MSNSQIPYAGNYVRVVCSLYNALRLPLVTSSVSDGILAKRIMVLAKSSNKL